MSNQGSNASTLARAIWSTDSAARETLRAIVLIAVGSALLTLSAKINVPFWPVPMTMQTSVVLMIGAAYGWRLGTATVLAYLVQGAMGLPVFSGTPEKGIGLAYMMGSSGGYLIGFLAMAAITGWFSERGADRNPLVLFAVMVMAEAVLYAFGLYWLGTLLGWDKPILEWGFYPFILGDLLKALLACAAILLGWRVFRQLRG